MDKWINNIWEADCLELLPLLPDHFVDLVLCDLPYGTTNNPWDCCIDLDRLWRQYLRIIKPGGAVVLTGQGIFTGCLIMSNPEWFKYKIVWIKSSATNFLNANKQPLRKHEDLCVFYNKQPVYHPQKSPGEPYDKGTRKDSVVGTYGAYKSSRAINTDGRRYPTDVLYIDDHPDYICTQSARPDGTYHPTQKPIELGRWLIRSYTDPGAIVLDNACGSGSFMVAAVLENRQFLGIEKNEQTFHLGKPVDFIAVCKERIKKAYTEIRLLKNLN